MTGSSLLFSLESSKIAFLKFIFEGYDHLAILTILDPQRGICKLSFYPKEKELIYEILQDFGVKFLNNL